MDINCTASAIRIYLLVSSHTPTPDYAEVCAAADVVGATLGVSLPLRAAGLRGAGGIRGMEADIAAGVDFRSADSMNVINVAMWYTPRDQIVIQSRSPAEIQLFGALMASARDAFETRLAQWSARTAFLASRTCDPITVAAVINDETIPAACKLGAAVFIATEAKHTISADQCLAIAAAFAAERRAAAAAESRLPPVVI